MARRLNTKFLTVLLLGAVGVVGAGIVATKLVIREHPDRYISLGNDAMKAHNWQEAVQDFAKAGQLSPKDPAIQMMLGKALGNLIQTDPTAAKLQVGAYSHALEIDPKYLPAMEALIDLYTQAAAQEPNAFFYESAIDLGTRARELDPTNETFVSLPDKLRIQEWINGLSSDQAIVDAAVKELDALSEKHPEDADLRYWIGQAQIQKGMTLANQNQNTTGGQLPEVTALYKQALEPFEKALTGANGESNGGPQDRNAAMHYSFARLLEEISGLDQSSPDALKKDQDQAIDEIKRAVALVKPDDPKYLEINGMASDMYMRRNDPTDAIGVYKAMPETPMTDLAMADLMARSVDSRPDAIVLMKKALSSLPDDPNHIVYPSLRFRLMLALANAQVMDYAEKPDAPNRQKLHDDLVAQFAKLDQIASYRNILELKRVEGRFGMTSGVDAEMQEILDLNKLMADDDAAAKDYFLEMLLAQGYTDTGQSANAVDTLNKVVLQFPRDKQARKRLIRLLLTEQPDQVPAHLDELARQDPNDTDLNVLRLQYLLTDPVKNTKLIQQVYVHLNEDTVRQLSLKGRVAAEIKDYDEAQRLLIASTTKDPKNLDDWIVLAKLQYQIGKKDDALATANRALEANPGSPQLRLLIPAMKGEDIKQIRDVQEELAKEDPDKVKGELMLAGVAQRGGDSEGQLSHLKAAETLSPNSGRVLDGLFLWYLNSKDYQAAASYIPKLAKVDYDHVGGALYELSLAEAQDDHAGAEAIGRKLVQDRPDFPRTWLALGDVLQNEGNYAEAVPQYQNCIQKQSNLVEAYTGLARCYYGLQKPDDALHTIEEGLQKNPENDQLQHMKLTHLMNYGDPKEAVTEIESEINARTNPPPELFAYLTEVVLHHADILRANNQPQDAKVEAQYVIDALKPEMAKWPDEPIIFVSMAEALMAAERPQDALNILQQWAANDTWKAKPQPYVALSDYYERTGNPDKAEDELHDALAKSGYQMELQIRLASLLALHKKYDDSLQLLRAVNTDKPAVREKIVQILILAGKFDEAQAQLKDDLVGNPPDAGQLLTVWALALFERGQFADAVDKSTQALAISPKNQTALYCRGRARLQVRPPDAAGALQDLDLVRQSNPNNVEIRMYMADAHLRLNQTDDATADLTVALRAQPLNKAVRFKLVQLDLDALHPRLIDALQLLQQVDTTSPFDKDPDVFQTEAVINSKMGNSDDALSHSEMALKLAPDNAIVVRTNMQILEQRKDDQGVVTHYAAMNDKLKQAAWALWTVARAEKHLNNPQALDDFKRALAATETEDDPANFDLIARDIGQQFTIDEAIGDVMPMAKDYVSAKLTLAHLYQLKGQDIAALSTMDDLMAELGNLKPRDQVNVLSNAAIMYQVAKPARADKAYDAYQRWLKLEPNNIEALNNMACLLADGFTPPRAQEGLQYINQAISEMSSLGRTEPRLLDTQAWLMILNGSAQDGVNILNTVILQDFQPIPEEYLHLGEGYLRLPVPDPIQAESQANQGMRLINKRNGGHQDDDLRAKLQDLINRSEAMKQNKQ